jgi:cysteine synthase
VPFAIDDAHRFTEADAFQAMRESWTSGAVRVDGSQGADTVAAMEDVLRRATDSKDHRRWHAALERIADEEPGTDPEGIQFTAD